MAVINSLFCLAMQVSYGNRLLRTLSHYDALMLAQGVAAVMIQNPELSSQVI
jgi:hypothetical protein